MKGVEFIGIYHPAFTTKDAVRGIAFYRDEKDSELLMVFFLGGSIWKRPGRRDILEKVLLMLKEDSVIVQRQQHIRFNVTKFLTRDLNVEKLERELKNHIEYLEWRTK